MGFGLQLTCLKGNEAACVTGFTTGLLVCIYLFHLFKASKAYSDDISSSNSHPALFSSPYSITIGDYILKVNGVACPTYIECINCMRSIPVGCLATLTLSVTSGSPTLNSNQVIFS